MDEQIKADVVYEAVPVWDIPTRVLHWLKALTVIILVALALTMWEVESLGLNDEAAEMLMAMLKKKHTYFGYFLAVIYTLRVIWGFAGNRYARFSDLISFKREYWKAIESNLKWYL
ncbi:MAG: cytochrome, partial [Deltaproteobacteria bacterium]|nr:cytochrome [Deltaproteobacteria bacterium]